MSLTTRARKLYDNRRLAAQWVLAVRWLRAHSGWVLDSSRPQYRQWGAQ